MANIKAVNPKKHSQRNQSSLLSQERRRVRRMQIFFAMFCIILILSMVLSLVANS